MLFCMAADDWQVSKQRAESDFKIYLLYERLSYYVRDFVR